MSLFVSQQSDLTQYVYVVEQLPHTKQKQITVFNKLNQIPSENHQHVPAYVFSHQHYAELSRA